MFLLLNVSKPKAFDYSTEPVWLKPRLLQGDHTCKVLGPPQNYPSNPQRGMWKKGKESSLQEVETGLTLCKGFGVAGSWLSMNSNNFTKHQHQTRPLSP